ncbi:MAG: phosphatidylserine/phosphatidylglycerophosphate/cardiolipin synthase family protein [Neisseria sp.]|nr:phosphatidylserine/phosphatidylglycerophosphate/cardiolipin synthase family protein [Neisseria sp.]
MNTRHPETREDLASRLFARACGTDARKASSIDILLDSAENFPAWEEALSAARCHICIEMYIIADDDFGRRIRQILLDKLQQGVEVILVYDWLGSLSARLRGFFQPLAEAGARVYAYNPPTWTSIVGLESRNHRKSLIIDGETAFVSGLCISAAWQGDPARGISAWRDTGLRLRGEVVGGVWAAFADTLKLLGGVMPDGGGSPAPCGQSKARVSAATPGGTGTLRLDLNLIGMARRNLWLTDAYFIPTGLYVRALAAAARDGVDVRILVPRTSDIKWIGTVSRTQYRSLLEAGVRVFEWNGTMLHAKSAVADGLWARVGSTNLNPSSWYLNRELDILIEDEAAACRMEQIFLQDLAFSTELVLDERARIRLLRQREKHRFGRRGGRMMGMVRQAAQLGHIFDAEPRLVAPSEAWAYLSIGTAVLLLAALLWFVPQLVLWPLYFFLAAGGAGMAARALRQLARLNKKPPARQDGGGRGGGKG